MEQGSGGGSTSTSEVGSGLEDLQFDAGGRDRWRRFDFDFGFGFSGCCTSLEQGGGGGSTSTSEVGFAFEEGSWGRFNFDFSFGWNMEGVGDMDLAQMLCRGSSNMDPTKDRPESIELGPWILHKCFVVML